MPGRLRGGVTVELDTVAFLLGAGASCGAGLPALEELTHRIERDLPAGLRSLFQRISARSRAVGEEREPPSLEDVLGVCDGLLAAHVASPIASPRDLALLGHEIRKRAWQLLQPRRLDTAFLDPLAALDLRQQRLDLFSLNNDLVIESWCSSRGVRHELGFDRRGVWRGERLERAAAGVRLAKLHGSVDWQYKPGHELLKYRRLRSIAGRRVLRTPLPSVALVFPSRVKSVDSGPLARLLDLFGRVLASKALLVVVGCALRDEHIVRTILEAQRHNPELALLVVDPRPGPPLSLLAKRYAGANLPARIDFLRGTFGAALAGPLWRAIARLQASGRPSLPARAWGLLRQRQGLAYWPGHGFLAEDLVAASPATAAQVMEVVEAARPSPAVLGSYAEAWTELPSTAPDVEDPLVREALGRAIERLGLVELDAEAGGSRILAARRRDLWSIRASDSRLCTGAATGTLKPVTRRLTRSRSLALWKDSAFVIRGETFGYEGLGTLRRIPLAGGRSRVLDRALRPVVARPGLLLRLLRQIRLGGEAERVEVRDLLLEMGFLSWPTAVRALSSARLLIVESRRATVADLAHGGILGELPREYINLVDGAEIGTARVVLLENGVGQQGRVMAWNLVTGCLTELMQVAHGAAVAVLRGHLVVSISRPRPAGKVIAAPLRGEACLGAEVELLAGLDRPSRLLEVGGVWYCSTREGLARLPLDLP